MPARLNPRAVDTLLASLGSYQEQTRVYFERSWQNHVAFLKRNGFESPEDLVDAAFTRVASQVASGQVLKSQMAAPLLAEILRIAYPREEAKALPAEPPSTASPAPLDGLPKFLQTRFPKLYSQFLESTLADLRLEHALAASPLKARWILLQGCGALAAAAVLQLGYSALGRIAALWQARSSK